MSERKPGIPIFRKSSTNKTAENSKTSPFESTKTKRDDPAVSKKPIPTKNGKEKAASLPRERRLSEPPPPPKSLEVSRRVIPNKEKRLSLQTEPIKVRERSVSMGSAPTKGSVPTKMTKSVSTTRLEPAKKSSSTKQSAAPKGKLTKTTSSNKISVPPPSNKVTVPTPAAPKATPPQQAPKKGLSTMPTVVLENIIQFLEKESKLSLRAVSKMFQKILANYFLVIVRVESVELNENLANDPGALRDELKKIFTKHPNVDGVNLTHWTICGLVNDEHLENCIPAAVKHLNLAGCRNITDAAIPLFPRDLLQLDLTNCFKITDDGVQKLPPKLTFLSLAGCFKITNKSFSYLPQTILKLDVERCFKVKSKDWKSQAQVALEEKELKLKQAAEAKKQEAVRQLQLKQQREKEEAERKLKEEHEKQLAELMKEKDGNNWLKILEDERRQVEENLRKMVEGSKPQSGAATTQDNSQSLKVEDVPKESSLEQSLPTSVGEAPKIDDLSQQKPIETVVSSEVNDSTDVTNLNTLQNSAESVEAANSHVEEKPVEIPEASPSTKRRQVEIMKQKELVKMEVRKYQEEQKQQEVIRKNTEGTTTNVVPQQESTNNKTPEETPDHVISPTSHRKSDADLKDQPTVQSSASPDDAIKRRQAEIQKQRDLIRMEVLKSLGKTG